MFFFQNVTNGPWNKWGCICFTSQLFVWTGGSFTLLRTLDFKQRILSVAPFSRGQVPHLLVCTDRQTDSCLLLQWTNGRFESPKPLKLTGRATQAEAINTRAGDALLLVLVEGKPNFYFSFYCYLCNLSCEVHISQDKWVWFLVRLSAVQKLQICSQHVHLQMLQ